MIWYIQVGYSLTMKKATTLILVMCPLISGTAPWNIVNLEWEGKALSNPLCGSCASPLAVSAFFLSTHWCYFFSQREFHCQRLSKVFCPYRWKQHRSTAGLKLCQANCWLIIWAYMNIQPAAYKCFNSKNGKSFDTSWLKIGPWSYLIYGNGNLSVGIQQTGTSFVRYELKLLPNYCNSYCYGLIMIYNLSFRSCYFIYNC